MPADEAYWCTTERLQQLAIQNLYQLELARLRRPDGYHLAIFSMPCPGFWRLSGFMKLLGFIHLTFRPSDHRWFEHVYPVTFAPVFTYPQNPQMNKQGI